MSGSSRTSRRGAISSLAAILTVVLIAGLPALAAAEVDREVLEQRVQEEFGAHVIKVREGMLNGQRVLFVTMMREGGNDNAAFKVDTLAFDAESGEPLHGLLPDDSGAESLSSARTGMTEKRPDVLRGRPWR